MVFHRNPFRYTHARPYHLLLSLHVPGLSSIGKVIVNLDPFAFFALDHNFAAQKIYEFFYNG
jgi:hypothetical protein